MARGLLVKALALATCVSAANICGTRGTHDDSKINSYMGNFFYRTQSTFTLCASWCKKDTKCQSFRYSYWPDAAAQYCEYFDAGLDGNITADSTQPYYYYDAGCAFPSYADATATTTVVARVAGTTVTVTASVDNFGDTAPKTVTQTVTTTSTQQAFTQTVTSIAVAPASTQTIILTSTKTQTQFRTVYNSVFVVQPTTVTRAVGVPVTVTQAGRTLTSTRVVTTTAAIPQAAATTTRFSTVTVTASIWVTITRQPVVADVPERTVTTTTTGTVIRMAPRVVTTTVTRGWQG